MKGFVEVAEGNGQEPRRQMSANYNPWVKPSMPPAFIKFYWYTDRHEVKLFYDKCSGKKLKESGEET